MSSWVCLKCFVLLLSARVNYLAKCIKVQLKSFGIFPSKGMVVWHVSESCRDTFYTILDFCHIISSTQHLIILTIYPWNCISAALKQQTAALILFGLILLDTKVQGEEKEMLFWKNLTQQNLKSCIKSNHTKTAAVLLLPRKVELSKGLDLHAVVELQNTVNV